MQKKKTCKHFRNEVPSYVADELRVADKEPCEVCDTKERNIRTEYGIIRIPKFTLVGK
jgi:hypothetical protein